MISDAYIRVTCDTCMDTEEEIQLTALTRDAYDMRNVRHALERLGWIERDGKHTCEMCLVDGDDT